MEKEEIIEGLRTEIIHSYDLPKFFYGTMKNSAAKQAGTLGCLLWYSLLKGRTGHTRRTMMDVDLIVEEWMRMIVGLAVAHDKDEADRYEAAVDKCLQPILAAPIKQIREFYPKLLARMKNDPAVPFLVWRSYEVWIDQVLSKAPDEEIKVLKVELAKEIADLVEGDVREQLPEALMRALQWRSPGQLSKVKEAVMEAQTKGEKVRLRGRESCLFMEVGGSEEEPKVCIQI